MSLHNFVLHLRRGCVCAAAAAVLLSMASVATAQPGRFNSLLEPDYQRRDLPLFVRELDLDEAQRFVLETFFEDYDAAFRTRADEVRETMRSSRPSREPADPDKAAALEQARTRMRDLSHEIRNLMRETEDEEVRRTLREKYREEIGGLRDQMRELRPPPPEASEMQRYAREIAALMMIWQNERIRMRDELIIDLKGQLTDEQVESWPAFERKLRRLKTIPQGRLSGEQIDLIQFIEQMELSPDARAKLVDALSAYELRLDDALVARNNYLDTSQVDLFRAMQEQNAERGLNIVRRETQLRLGVRVVNEEYLAILLEAMPADRADEFRQNIYDNAFNRVYARTHAQRVFDAVLELEDLDPEVIDSIHTLFASYEMELTAFNDRLRDLIRNTEADRTIEQAERRAARMTGQTIRPTTDLAREEFTRRTEMGERYIAQLESILTPEQFEQLPQRSRRRGLADGRRGGGQRGFGGRGGQWNEERRAEFLRRFDRNGDGELDEQERRAMLEEMRDFGGGFRGRDGRRGGGEDGGRGGRGGERGGSGGHGGGQQGDRP